jgi:branched-chain amino acid transport system permease protein
MYSLVESLGVTFTIYALLAYSFAIPVSAGLLYAGQMGSMALAAYVTALGLTAGYPFALSAAAAVACVLVLSAALSRPALRLGELSMAIVTLGISQVIVTIASNLDTTGGSLGLRGVPATVTLAGAAVVLCLVIAALMVARRRGVLNMIRLVKEDPRVSESCGIDARAVRFRAFMAGAFLSAMSGVLYAGYLTYVSPAVFSFQTLLQIVAFALVGGVGSVSGPLVGTALLWLAPQFVPMIGEWRFVVYGVLIIGCVLWKPEGIMGRRSPSHLGSRRAMFATWRKRRIA